MFCVSQQGTLWRQLSFQLPQVPSYAPAARYFEECSGTSIAPTAGTGGAVGA